MHYTEDTYADPSGEMCPRTVTVRTASPVVLEGGRYFVSVPLSGKYELPAMEYDWISYGPDPPDLNLSIGIYIQ